MKRLSFFIYIAVIVAGCAHQVTPSGGPKDSTPPQIVSSIPENFSTDFSGNQIILAFDEFIQIKNFEKSLVVTPSLRHTPKYKLTGKKLIIELRDTLLPNTTYTFNFGESIQDITEGNPLDSNIFVFSTGSVLDSLFVKGVVKDAFSLEPQKDISVFLYMKNIDSLPFNSLPDYIGQTDENGFFSINHLPDKKFKIVAVDDKNHNKKADLQESFAFIDSLILPSDSVIYQLYTYMLSPPEKQYIVQSSFLEKGKAAIYFNLPNDSLNIRYISPCKTCLIETNDTKDTVFIWTHSDSLHIAVYTKHLSDTLRLTYISSPKRKQNTAKTEQARLHLMQKRNVFPFYQKPVLVSHFPISKIYPEKWFLIHQADTFPVAIQQVSLHKIIIDTLLKENRFYELFILPHAVVNFNNQINDSLKIKLQTTSSNNYALLKVTTDFKQSQPFVLHLVKDNKTMKNIYFNKDTVLIFRFLPAGDYRLRLIFDKNKNRQWDGGNYMNKEYPEKVIYYPEIIKIPKGWEIEITWKM